MLFCKFCECMRNRAYMYGAVRRIIGYSPLFAAVSYEKHKTQRDNMR